MPAPVSNEARSNHVNHFTDDDDDDDDDDDEDDSDDKVSRASSVEGRYDESLDKDRFLTPVIRVTITSTVKQ